MLTEEAKYFDAAGIRGLGAPGTAPSKQLGKLVLSNNSAPSSKTMTSPGVIKKYLKNYGHVIFISLNFC